MSVDDDLFAPILPPEVMDKLRDLIKRVMNTPRSNSSINSTSKDIMDLMHQHGFDNDAEIADFVKRIIADEFSP